LGDATVPVFCRRSRRARRLQVRVEPRGILLVLPWSVAEAEGERFLHRHARWAIRRLGELRRAQAQTPPLSTGARLPFRGGELRLEIRHPDAEDGVQSVFREGDVLTVSCRQADFPAAVVGPLRTWFASQAAALADALVARCSDAIGAVPRVVRIRDLRSRWGSCAASQAVSLNWRLILAPDGVFEYVVAHELCHLRHGGHRPAFWSLVRTSVPDADESRKWLRKNQEWMMAFLRDSDDGTPEGQEGCRP
jgi:hypothetical protein